MAKTTGPKRKVSNRLDVDKILFDHEFEKSVLGAMLLERDAFQQIAEMFNPQVFDDLPNRYIAEAIVALFSKSQPIDILTVTKELKAVGLLEATGGAYYVSSTTNRIASSANIVFHYRILQQYYLDREMVRIGDEAKNRVFSYGNDTFETYDWMMGQLESLLNSVHSKKASTIFDLYKQEVAEMREIQKTGQIPGISSGFRHIDNISGGWQKSDSIILAARPGMGKTAFVVCCAYNSAVINGVPVGMFSLEMSGRQLARRVISLHTDIESHKIIKHKLTTSELDFIEEQGMSKMAGVPFFIDDTAAISIFEFRAKARRMVNENGVQLIIVDYLQLMKGEGGNREQEISSISAAIKQTAKELDIPIIALSQLSRQVENRPAGSKKPQLSDLRESGSIEQDADMVMFLYRPEYYGMEEYDLMDTVVPAKDLAIVITAKNRHGEIGETPMAFIGSKVKFESYDMGNIGNTITKQDVIEHQNVMKKYNSSEIKQPEKDYKQETLTNNEDFLSQTNESNDSK